MLYFLTFEELLEFLVNGGESGEQRLSGVINTLSNAD